jgi:hypothetical protein
MINEFKETRHVPDLKVFGWPPKVEARGFNGTRRCTRFVDSKGRGDQPGSRKWKVFGKRFVMSRVLEVRTR